MTIRVRIAKIDGSNGDVPRWLVITRDHNAQGKLSYSAKSFSTWRSALLSIGGKP